MNKKLYTLIKTYIEKNSKVSNISKSYIDFETTDKIIEFLKENKDDLDKNIQDSINLNNGYMVKIDWLDNCPDATKEVGYIMSFKEAGDILVEHSKDVRADYMVYSVMFNYMHYLELTLKCVLSKNNEQIPFTHNINDLWNETKPVITNILKQDEITIIDSIFTSIFPITQTSMYFRYKTDKQGQDNIPNTYRLDLYVVKIWIDVYDTIIHGIYNT